MLTLSSSMLAGSQSNETFIKAASITAATLLASYALYRTLAPKGPFDHLPQSKFVPPHSYIYDHEQRDQDIYQEYPPFEKVALAGATGLLVNDPKYAHQALLRQDRYKPGHLYGRSPLISYFHSVLIGGANIANATGEDWKHRRDLLVPHFQGRVLIPELFPFILKSTMELVEEIRAHNGKPIDMDERFVTLTADIICEYIFGGVPDDGHLVFDNFGRPATAIATIKLQHILKVFGIKGKALLEIERNSNIIRGVIRGVKHGDRKRHNGSPTLVEEMLKLEEFQGPAGEERLVHELLIMIMAGHDTTAHSLTMLFYVLALHPECQQKIREEVNVIVPDDESISASDIGKLKYTSAAIRESMRLHPVLSSILLHAYEDTSLGNIEIPKGSNIEIPQVRIQRDPEVFKKPLAFKPERWLEEDLELQGDLEKVHGGKSQMTNAFLAFSQGTHSCLGMNLANLELRVVTALLVKHFDIRYNGPVPEQIGFILRAKESPLIEMHPRTSN
ncbi:hypothetical protein INT44_003234 [Umbelopsis vinacea]|uniref:Cytochrome P450 n=1 Tax=Umbelopsis vinacea TaxID=44442 RepID=A0A8H7Q924_9FUNG|nr:hypothetical protein INT44_003234 [Umbelopsis vinacea]